MKPKEINKQAIQDDEIDLTLIWAGMKKHWLMLLVSILLGGALAGAGSYYLITPQYESTAVMFILTKETTLTSLADLQIGSQLTNDYQVVVTSRTVLQGTIDDLGLSAVYNYKDLKKKIKINNPQNTRILEITAEDPSPELAKDIADSIARNAAEYIADTMEITPPKIIETGEVAVKKSSPSNSKNAVIGALIGFVLAMAYITISVIMNDTVATEDDVEKYLGLSVLASLPDRDNETDRKSKREKAKIKKEKRKLRKRRLRERRQRESRNEDDRTEKAE